MKDLSSINRNINNFERKEMNRIEYAAQKFVCNSFVLGPSGHISVGMIGMANDIFERKLMYNLNDRKPQKMINFYIYAYTKACKN